MKLIASVLLVSTALSVCAAPYPANSTLGERSLEERATGVVTTCKTKGHAALTFDDGPVRSCLSTWIPRGSG